MLLGDMLGCPNGMLLMHDVTAYHSAILIDDDGAVATLTDGTDNTLWHSMTVIGISELIE